MFGKTEQRHKEIIFMYDKLVKEIHGISVNLVSGLTNISKEIKIMATNLDVELNALSDQVTALGPAISQELQQVVDAINAGNDAATAVEDARSRITAMTDTVANAVASLKSDDVATQ